MTEHDFRPIPLVLAALLLGAAAAPARAQEASPAAEEEAATATEAEAEAETEAEAGIEAETEPALPEEDLAADFYLSRCAGCHTIGEGELSGPDLAKAVERMEKNVGPMTDEQVASQVELLKSEDVKQRLSAARERQVAEIAATLEPASPAAGEALFHGKRAFANRGVSCSACHKAGARGGNLAADLTDSHARLGEQALISAAENPGFALMRAAYASHPVTRQEAVHLAA
ncbi:MAG TPA: hypothetical protein VLF66_14005, partial [Thermoanaerobaculia bacterium]|nr:hypothetical protein [Thermoanaerobaculia bacterium]